MDLIDLLHPDSYTFGGGFSTQEQRDLAQRLSEAVEARNYPAAYAALRRGARPLAAGAAQFLLNEGLQCTPRLFRALLDACEGTDLGSLRAHFCDGTEWMLVGDSSLAAAAAFRDRPEHLALLLERGVDPNGGTFLSPMVALGEQIRPVQTTVLAAAVAAGSTDCAALLLARPGIKTDDPGLRQTVLSVLYAGNEGGRLCPWWAAQAVLRRILGIENDIASLLREPRPEELTDWVEAQTLAAPLPLLEEWIASGLWGEKELCRAVHALRRAAEHCGIYYAYQKMSFYEPLVKGDRVLSLLTAATRRFPQLWRRTETADLLLLSFDRFSWGAADIPQDLSGLRETLPASLTVSFRRQVDLMEKNLTAAIRLIQFLRENRVELRLRRDTLGQLDRFGLSYAAKRGLRELLDYARVLPLRRPRSRPSALASVLLALGDAELLRAALERGDLDGEPLAALLQEAAQDPEETAALMPLLLSALEPRAHSYDL